MYFKCDPLQPAQTPAVGSVSEAATSFIAPVTELSVCISFQQSVLFRHVFTVLICAAVPSVDVGGQEGHFKLSSSVKIQPLKLLALILFLFFLMLASSSQHSSYHISQ